MLDEEAWVAVQKLLNDTLKQILKLNAEAGRRLAKSKGESISASVSMLGYEVPDSAAKKLPKRKAKTKAKGKAKSKSKAKGRAQAKAKRK